MHAGYSIIAAMEKHTKRLQFGTFLFTVCLVALCFFFTGCQRRDAEAPITLVIEDDPDVAISDQILTVPFEEDVTVTLTPDKDVTVLGCDYPDATLERHADGTYALTLHRVRYPVTVSLLAEPDPCHITFHANCGEAVSGSTTELTRSYSEKKRRCNTLQGTSVFKREGYTLLGWNTAPDGTGTYIPCGSRIAVEADEPKQLYAQWIRQSDPSLFSCETKGDHAMITGYYGQEDPLVIPSSIDGQEVSAIAEEAFAGMDAVTVVLPPTLKEVEVYAFRDSKVETLYLYDGITEISDYAFSGCSSLHTIYLNACRPPAYSGTYYDTFPDKYDYLQSIAEFDKLVLFSGSSTRFGYDSVALDAAFADYAVADMGVFAYTNALPQLDLILMQMHAGDLLLHSPEFDAAKRQFCTTNAFDDKFFCLIESDYALLSLLDYQAYTGVFSAFCTFQKTKTGMAEKSYDLSPCDFNEDGEPTGAPSYNRYGDYVVPRPDASDDHPIYDLPVDYTAASYDETHYIAPLNAVYDQFAKKGIACLFTYAPRNRQALSDASTPAAIEALDQYFRDELHATVISDPMESLYPGRYLFGTDNHLSTEGAAIRTERIITDLNRYLSQEAKEAAP